MRGVVDKICTEYVATPSSEGCPKDGYMSYVRKWIAGSAGQDYFVGAVEFVNY